MSNTKNFSPDIIALSQALGCKPANVVGRLNFLKMVLVTCGRCGGEGRYSFNLKDGDVCYGCMGMRLVMPKKVTSEQIEEVRVAVAAGALEPYFRQQEARRLAKDACQKTLAVWTATRVAKVNDHIFGTAIARDRNAQMCYLFQVVKTVTAVIENQTATQGDMEAFSAEFPALLQRIVDLDLSEEEAAQCAAENARKKAEWKASVAA